MLFPRGLESRKNKGVRTASTMSLFRSLQGSEEAKYGMVPLDVGCLKTLTVDLKMILTLKKALKGE